MFWAMAASGFVAFIAAEGDEFSEGNADESNAIKAVSVVEQPLRRRRR